MFLNRHEKRSIERKYLRMMNRQLLENEAPHEDSDDCPTIEGAHEVLAPIPEEKSWADKRKLYII